MGGKELFEGGVAAGKKQERAGAWKSFKGDFDVSTK